MKLEAFRSQGPPSHDLAFEADLLDRASRGRCSALVTSWPGPVVVLGYAQKPGEVDLEWCRRNEIPVLRRLSGGTGVIHRGDLGVALALPKEHPWSEGIVELYDRYLDVLEPALVAVGARVERVVEPRRGSRVRSPICFEDQHPCRGRSQGGGMLPDQAQGRCPDPRRNPPRSGRRSVCSSLRHRPGAGSKGSGSRCPGGRLGRGRGCRSESAGRSARVGPPSSRSPGSCCGIPRALWRRPLVSRT